MLAERFFAATGAGVRRSLPPRPKTPFQSLAEHPRTGFRNSMPNLSTPPATAKLPSPDGIFHDLATTPTRIRTRIGFNTSRIGPLRTAAASCEGVRSMAAFRSRSAGGLTAVAHAERSVGPRPPHRPRAPDSSGNGTLGA